MFPDIYFIGSLFFVNFVVGIISWPVTQIFFSKLLDKGYTISHILGWVALSYISFLLVTLKLLPLSTLGAILSLLIWFGINIFVQIRFKVISFSKINWYKIALTQILFLSFVVFLYWVRGHGSEIYQIERFMDYGFIRSLFNANSLPLYNFWLSGEVLNYYYFGHYIGYTILKLASIPPEPGFFILLFWIFGVTGINVFNFGYEFYRKLGKSRILGLFSGTISVFLVLFAGTFHSLIWLYGYIKHILLKSPEPAYWYADATRYIEGTITEMPLYGFLVADLHPHIWAIPIGVFGIYILYSIWISKNSEFNYKNKYIYLTCFVLGIAYMINSWDVLTLGVLLVGALILKHKDSLLQNKRKFLVGVVTVILMPIFAYSVSLPWSYFFEPPVSGVGIVGKNLVNCSEGVCEKRSEICPGIKCYEKADLKCPECSTISKFVGHTWEPSTIQSWMAYWGPFLLFFIIYIINFRKKIYKSLREFKLTDKNLLPFYIFLVTMLFWVLVEIFYMKDLLKDGDWYRANTVFKVGNQLWIWIGMIFGSLIIYIFKDSKRNILGLISILLFWMILNVQFIYPIKAIKQSFVNGSEFTGITRGLKWWENSYPNDYKAYQFLSKRQAQLPANDRVRNIVEADGNSFEDFNFYSTFLGWPTILGWYGHIWTWHGTNDFIGDVKNDVTSIYTNSDIEKTKEILDKYSIDYIILGEIEKNRYGADLKENKLEAFGDVVYVNESVKIIAYSKRAKLDSNY